MEKRQNWGKKIDYSISMKIFWVISAVQKRFKHDGKLHASFLGNFNIVFQIISTFDDFSEKRQNWGKMTILHRLNFFREIPPVQEAFNYDTKAFM